MDRVIIRHPDGREYDIPLSAFDRDRVVLREGTEVTYQAAGFAIVSYADGSPYEAPADEPRGAKGS